MIGSGVYTTIHDLGIPINHDFGDFQYIIYHYIYIYIYSCIHAYIYIYLMGIPLHLFDKLRFMGFSFLL